MKRVFDLEDRLIDFGVSIIKLTEFIRPTIAGNHLSRQLIKSGTSPGLHYGEAQSAESRRDFIHKIKLVLKELRETRANLIMIQRASLCKIEQENKLASIIIECNELVSIFSTSVKTASSKR
jgi:four helix bundle protein